MEIVISIVVGVMLGCCVYLLLSRNIIKIIVGILLLSNVANLILFAMGRFTSIHPPIIPTGVDIHTLQVANPLPQALILTAIVIGFGLSAFAVSLCLKVYTQFRTIDADKIKSAEGNERAS